MRTTAPVARFLRRLPEPIAADLCDTITAALARDSVAGAGFRAIFPGLAWRLDAHGCRLTFTTVEGEPYVVTARFLKDAPVRAQRRSGGAARQRA